MEPSPWMGPQETCPESKNRNFPSKKTKNKQKRIKKKKQMEPSPWMGPQGTCPESKNCNFPSQKNKK